VALTASPSALSLRQSNIAYAFVSPLFGILAVLVPCLVGLYAGALAALVATASVVGLGATATRSPRVRRRLDRQVRRRARRRRDARRLAKLRATGTLREYQYVELRNLIETLEEADVERFDLDGLIERFVELSVIYERYCDALRLADFHDHAPPLPATPGSEIRARRVRHRERCIRDATRISDELEAIDELVHLIAQRVTCPLETPEGELEIERRLIELDHLEAAFDELSDPAAPRADSPHHAPGS
jgi:hypothetical protein